MKWKSQAISGTGRTFIVPANEGLGVVQDTPTATNTLDISDSGKTIILNAAEGFAINLPGVQAGLKYKFLVGAVFATTNFTVVAPANKIQGGAVVNSTFVPAVDENTISFVATAETIGDYVELECDGTNWIASGNGALAGSITFTAP
jgi:hypothetical protein